MLPFRKNSPLLFGRLTVYRLDTTEPSVICPPSSMEKETRGVLLMTNASTQVIVARALSSRLVAAIAC
jgi:hypothetical protein